MKKPESFAPKTKAERTIFELAKAAGAQGWSSAWIGKTYKRRRTQIIARIGFYQGQLTKQPMNSWLSRKEDAVQWE